VEESGEKWRIEPLDRWGRNVQNVLKPLPNLQTFLSNLSNLALYISNLYLSNHFPIKNIDKMLKNVQ